MHTPGPWKMVDVKDGRGNPCAYSVWPDRERPFINSPIGNQICRTPDGTTKEAMANARLIAAAPELLEVLSAIFKEADTNPFNPIGHVIEHVVTAARTAINKARGV